MKHTIDNHVSYQVVEYDGVCLVPLGTMQEVQGLEIIVLVVLGQEGLFAWKEVGEGERVVRGGGGGGIRGGGRGCDRKRIRGVIGGWGRRREKNQWEGDKRKRMEERGI